MYSAFISVPSEWPSSKILVNSKKINYGQPLDSVPWMYRVKKILYKFYINVGRGYDGLCNKK